MAMLEKSVPSALAGEHTLIQTAARSCRPLWMQLPWVPSLVCISVGTSC